MTSTSSNILIERAAVREWLDAACAELVRDPSNEKLQHLMKQVCEAWRIPIPNELIGILKKH